MKLLFYLLFSMSIFSSCQKIGSNAQAAPAATNHTLAETKLNVPYGKDTAQRMDIYLPAGRSAATTRAIVLIHGGGWNSGSKESFASYIDTLKKRLPHYAIFNIGYRLVSEKHLFPTQENDIRAAFQFIADQAPAYGINKEKVSVLGVSAGAHLALLQAYKYTEPINVQAVIDFFGPTDLLEMYHKPWHSMIPFLLQTLTGATPATNQAIYKSSSPVYFVDPQTPPTLIFHGGNDPIVPLVQSKLLKAKLAAAGVQHELVVYPKERHGWYGANMTDAFNRMEAFLEKELQ